MLLLVLISLLNTKTDSYITKLSCEGQKMILECDPSYIIRIVRANFGRLSSSVCTSNNETGLDTGCIFQPTKSILDNR